MGALPPARRNTVEMDQSVQMRNAMMEILSVEMAVVAIVR